ncbi:hypothetical protein P43SY_001985 [Pythium insidiosum]|uniref:Serine protease family S33 n=1 Tax=Pythium insidiosum TaxID=114742 RepID=A0AAD5LQ08_PYTIN|nr:hypothetical protein P43SY_001985 [Pythium insidiosum]
MTLFAALVASSLALYGAVDATDGPRVNGWYPCAESDDDSSGAPNGTLASLATFECAEVKVPLCYDGVCDSDDTIELFVRRRLAKKKPADGQPRALFRVPGGPGQTSVIEEGWMVQYAESLDDTVDMYTDRLKVDSGLLYNIIVYSERWSQPSPTKAEHTKFFHDCPFPLDTDALQQVFCEFNGFKDPACADYKTENSSSSEGFHYEHDKYFDAPVVLPDHASALIINGGLDFATPLEFGELLYKKLRDTGRGAMKVNFAYGTHCGGEAVEPDASTPCRDGIISSFIANDGDVDEVSLACMDEIPTASFA